MAQQNRKQTHPMQDFFRAHGGEVFAFAALVGFLAWTYVWYIPAIKEDMPRVAYPLIDPGRNLIHSQDLLVNFQPLRESLAREYQDRQDYLVSIYFEYLPTGANVSINKDEKIWPASLMKIPIAMAAMKKIQDGQWKGTNELVILDEDKDPEYGTLYQKPTGTRMTIDDLLYASLVHSDNTAHFVLLRNLEEQELEDLYTHLGFDDLINALKRSPATDALDNRITAKLYSVFFRSLYNATFLSPAYSNQFLNLLTQSEHGFSGAGLPNTVLFAHKIGIREDDKVYADSGIVYLSERPYLLTVMIQGKRGTGNQGEALGLMKDISREIYTYVSSDR